MSSPPRPDWECFFWRSLNRACDAAQSLLETICRSGAGTCSQSPVGRFERFDKPVMITMWQPHMHIRGKYQCINAIYPTNPVKVETLSCASWNYNWHTAYNYADDVMPILPAGTIIQVVSWMDNSTSNKFNPDAKNWTGDGGRTIDEMATSWVGWYDLTDEEYKAAAAARKAKNSRPSN